jgi:ABC-type Fe3+-hydroxamate transport system substrate-binding protein
MMSLRLLSAPAVLALLLLTACTTTTPPSTGSPAGPVAPATGAAPTQPAAAVVVADTRPATIRGSEETSTLLDNFTVFITALDGQPIGSGRKGWNQPITFVPGKRRFAVEFIRGAFTARTELTLEAKPGAAYQLRHASDAQVYGEHTFCEFWIVDLATGEKVTPARRTGLGKLTTGG